MVRNLLAMTRIDAGALEVRRDWVDLREIASAPPTPRAAHGAKQTIAVQLPDELPMVHADAKLVEQALANVVANAVAHTPTETHVVDRRRSVGRRPLPCASPTMVAAYPRALAARV